MPTDLRSVAQRDVGVVDVLAEDGDFAGGGDVAVALVDAVEAAQQRGLAAARRTDQRRDDARLDVDRRRPCSAWKSPYQRFSPRVWML